MYQLSLGLALAFLLTACSSLPENSSEPSYTLDNLVNNQLEQKIISANREIGFADNAVTMLLLDDGTDAFIARLSLLNSAQNSVDLQYYLYHSDLSGNLLTMALWQAAERGVRVRLLLDDMDMAGKDKTLSALASHPNINIRLFNPFVRGKNRSSQFVFQFGAITRRMHNKSFTVDNSISILGGRNIGDVYFGADENTVFGDLDVALTGPVVTEVSHSFDAYWNSPLAYPIQLLSSYEWEAQTTELISQALTQKWENKQQHAYVKQLKANNLMELIHTNQVNIYTGEAKILVDDPAKITASRSKQQYHLAPQLAPYIHGAENELIIVSPYFVPGKEGVEFFADLIKRGITVKVLTNSLKSNDVMVVHAGYRKYRKALLAMGVKLYEMDSKLLTSDYVFSKTDNKKSSIWGKSKASLHAKYFVIDRKSTFIGSLNLDPRSLYENTEIGVILETEALSEDVAEQFDNHINQIAFELSLVDNNIIWSKIESGETITYDKEPYSSWWERFKVGFISYLPGESQL
ncbi:phospholipase D family protein [Psychromonas sp. psych-6C06]|uniref:phospholipase D family protein n=1 Tax=Psychromonas sp. psych-6C06 TaxID=2058089 RepID=UPI00187C324B|nr:phospholipase D family protein [Psychromonas sp. psych-6C06]